MFERLRPAEHRHARQRLWRTCSTCGHVSARAPVFGLARQPGEPVLRVADRCAECGLSLDDVIEVPAR